MATLLALVLTACSTTAAEEGPRASGEVGGQVVAGRVDSAIAAYYLEDYPSKHPRGWHDDVAAFERAAEHPDADRDTFAAIANESGSVDLAALLFLHHVRADQRNRRFAECLEHVRDRLSEAGPYMDGELEQARNRFHVVLVPGWLYQDQATTEADFERTRAALTRAGIRHELLDAPQDGTVEHNAGILATYLREHAPPEREIILVSASKSGAEVHYALGHLLAEDETGAVAAWINAGGMIRGTPLADAWTSLPRNLIARPVMAWHGWSWDSLRSLRTDRTRDRRQHIELPDDIVTINYVAVPMASQITHGAERRHRRLARQGPNDAATLLSDARVDNAITVTEPGTDHYFLRVDIGQRTLILTRAIQALIDDEPCPPALRTTSTSAARAPAH